MTQVPFILLIYIISNDDGEWFVEFDANGSMTGHEYHSFDHEY